MKKIAKILITFVMLFSTSSLLADVSSELRTRLNKVSQFSADFVQTVSSADGKQVQRAEGKIQIKRPNLFRMDNKMPQQSQIISDGKTLWVYDPFVEQVTANWVKDVINNTPFVLLTSNDKFHWNQYNISQKGDIFLLKPKTNNSSIKQFDIRIDKNGVLKGFGIIEKDGQTNVYILRNFRSGNLADRIFRFTLPKGVEFDDQRN